MAGISRRKFVKGTVATGLMAAGAGIAPGQDRKPTKPNILLIIDDQHNPRAMGWTGQTQAVTPHLDRLAAEGVCFTNAYSSCPVCAPARHSIYTGLYASQHGVLHNDRPMRQGTSTVMARLNRAGYTTASIGKMHNAPYHHRRDFQYVLHHEFFVGPAGISHYAAYLASELKKRALEHKDWHAGVRNWLEDPATVAFVNWLPEDLTPERWITDQCLKFIRDQLSRSRNSPFFLHASYFPPHHPYAPIARYADLHDPEKIKLPPNFDRQRLDAWCNGRSRPARLTDEQLKRWLALYYGFTSQLDSEIGRLLAGLDSLGVSDNTVVIFVSDHGDMIAEHGMFYKGLMYEGSARVPFIVRWPGVQGPRREAAPVSHLDIAPTVLHAAGVEPDAQLPGKDLRPLIAGRDDGWKDRAVYSEFFAYLPFSKLMVRHGRYKLMANISRRGKRQVAYKLYDVAGDPWETKDLARDPAFASTCNGLKERLMAHWQRQEKLLPKTIQPPMKRSRYNIAWPADPWQPVQPA